MSFLNCRKHNKEYASFCLQCKECVCMECKCVMEHETAALPQHLKETQGHIDEKFSVVGGELSDECEVCKKGQKKVKKIVEALEDAFTFRFHEQ